MASEEIQLEDIDDENRQCESHSLNNNKDASKTESHEESTPQQSSIEESMVARQPSPSTQPGQCTGNTAHPSQNESFPPFPTSSAQSEDDESTTFLAKPTTDLQPDVPEPNQDTGIYTSEDRFVFRLHKIVQTLAVCVLHLILMFATQDKLPSMSFFDYFVTVKNKSKGHLKGLFRPMQLDALQTDTSGKSFDVTQLYCCIICVYAETDPPMDHVRCIKNFRNKLMHGKMQMNSEIFVTTTNDLRHHFTEALKKAGEMTGIAMSILTNHINDMNNTLNKVISEQIVQWDITSYENELLYEKKVQSLLTVGPENLRVLYKEWTYLNPLSFLCGNTHLHVGMVFTQLEIVESGRTGANQILEYQDLFQTYTNISQDRGSPRIILVEGPAGSGKSTLTKMIIDDWTNKKDEIKGVNQYQLLLYTECRNPFIKNLQQLLTVLMPDVAKKHREDDIVPCVQACKVLLIVDALDEMTSSARMLFEEILSQLETMDFTLLVTSRPETVEDFYKMIPLGTDAIHVKIKGIPEDRREEFVLKYHSEMERSGQSAHDTSGLINYLRRTGVRLKEHWRLPLHLAMVVILWVISPDAINGITTATELFRVTESLRDEKLCERVKKNEQCKGFSVKEIKEKIENFRLSLYKISLYCQRTGDCILTDDAVDNLEKVCSILQLPVSEMMGAFFVKRITWMGTGTQMHYSFAHKETQDFYSALYIINALRGKACPEALEQMNIGCVDSWQKLLSLKRKSVLNILKDVYRSSPDNFNLKKFQNILIHLTGLIDCQIDLSRKEVSTEVVKLLKKSGIADEQAWLDILGDIKTNDATVKEISKYLPDLMNLQGHLEITDSRVATYAKMIVHANPKRITLRIANDPMQVPYLQDMLEGLYYQKGEIELYFYHNFLNPHLADTLDTESPLPQLFKTSRVTTFMGHVDQALMRKLPEGLRTLCVAVVDERHYQMIMSKICTLPKLEWLWIHARAGVDLKQYPQLLETNHVTYRSEERALFVRKWTKSPLDLPRLEELLALVDGQYSEEARMAFRCVVDMQLSRDFRCPEEFEKATDVGLQRIFSRFKVTTFRGCIGHRAMRSLPNTIKRLSILIVDNDHYKTLEPELISLQEKYPLLRRFCMHIGPSVNPSVLRALPKVDCWVSLFLSGLKDEAVEWAAKVAKTLQPTDWYSSIVLPELNLSLAGFTQLTETLASNGVTIMRGGGILVPLSWASQDLQPEAESVTRKNLHCSLLIVEEIW